MVLTLSPEVAVELLAKLQSSEDTAKAGASSSQLTGMLAQALVPCIYWLPIEQVTGRERERERGRGVGVERDTERGRDKKRAAKDGGRKRGAFG